MFMQRNKIYKTKEWYKVREKVLAMDKGWCQRCCGNYKPFQSQRKLTKAVLVHHHFEVSQFPQFKYDIYVNIAGKKHRNLYSLCNFCHEQIHNRKANVVKETNRFENEERWD